MTSGVIVEKSDQILAFRFNRPDKKHAINQEMYLRMAEALERAEKDDDLRVIIFKSSAGNFTAGNDLRDFVENPPTSSTSPVCRFLAALPRVRVPIIAAVDGLAIGIGFTLLLHCDFVFVTEYTRLQMPFVDLGVVPEAGSTYLLPYLVGHTKAAEITLLGSIVDGDEAVRIGVATAKVPAERLEAKTMETARILATKPPSALRNTRGLLRADRKKVEQAIELELKLFGHQLARPETKGAMTNFLNKKVGATMEKAPTMDSSKNVPSQKNDSDTKAKQDAGKPNDTDDDNIVML